MKRLIVFVILGGISLTAGAQVAADNAVRIRGYQIEMPDKIHKMYKGDFDDFKGTYNLSNDEVLRMSQQGRRMYAAVGEQEPRELVAVGPNVFVALDRKLKITLNDGFHGAVTGEVLMAPRGAPLAGGPESEPVRVVARR